MRAPKLLQTVLYFMISWTTIGAEQQQVVILEKARIDEVFNYEVDMSGCNYMGISQIR